MISDWTSSLRKYQLECADWILATPLTTRGRLLADGLGFGKTREALAGIRKRFEAGRIMPKSSRCIVAFCPAIARSDWIHEAKIIWPELQVLTVGWDDPKKKSKESKEEFDKRRDAPIAAALQSMEPHLLLSSYQSAYRVYDLVIKHKILLPAVICDEAHILKYEKTLSSRVTRPIIARSEFLLLITGTPIHNRGEDLHYLLELCAPGKLMGKWRWASKYFRIEVSNFGRRIREPVDKEGLRESTKPYVLARSVAEAYGELPACIRKIVTVTAPSPMPFRSKESLRHFLTGDETEGIDKLLREAAGAKIAKAVELAISLDEPVVCYTQERAHAAELCRALNSAGVEALLATGVTDPKRRATIIEGWKAGEAVALVCTMDAVRESATLTRASAMIFCDLDWLPGKQRQCEGRIDPSRQPEGQRRPARYYYLVIENGPDEVVALRVIEKIEQAQGILTVDASLDALSKSLGDACHLEERGELKKNALADLVGRLIAQASRVEKVAGGLGLLEHMDADAKEEL